MSAIEFHSSVHGVWIDLPASTAADFEFHLRRNGIRCEAITPVIDDAVSRIPISEGADKVFDAIHRWFVDRGIHATKTDDGSGAIFWEYDD